MESLIVLLILLSFIGIYINFKNRETLIAKNTVSDPFKKSEDILKEKISEELKEEKINTPEEDQKTPVKTNNIIGSANKVSNLLNTKQRVKNNVDNVQGNFSYTRKINSLSGDEGSTGNKIEAESIRVTDEPSYIKRNRTLSIYGNKKLNYTQSNYEHTMIEPDISDARNRDNIKGVNISFNILQNAHANSYKNNIDLEDTNKKELLVYSKNKILPGNFGNDKIEYTHNIDISNGEYIPSNNDIFNTGNPNITINEDKKQINRLFLKK